MCIPVPPLVSPPAHPRSISVEHFPDLAVGGGGEECSPALLEQSIMYVKVMYVKVMENNLEKQLTPEESLSIISASMEKSREDMLENAGAPMYWWGSLMLVFSLAVFFLWDKTGSSAWNCLWFAMAIIGYIVGKCTYGKKRKGIRSFISVIMQKVWGTFGILAVSSSTLIVLCVLGILRFFPTRLLSPDPVSVPITVIIVVLLGCSTTVTGWILKNGWIAAAGLLTGIVGTAFAVALPGAHQELVLTGVSLVGLILPGLIIDKGRCRHE